jgi:pimeloyl-ACP methyl ester carboxylesterase
MAEEQKLFFRPFKSLPAFFHLLLIPGGPGSSHNYFYPAMERLAKFFQVV